MSENAGKRLSYWPIKPFQRTVSIGYQLLSFCRKYSTRSYTRQFNDRIVSRGAPSGATQHHLNAPLAATVRGESIESQPTTDMNNESQPHQERTDTRLIDGETYHVVCHHCGFEGLTDDEAEAKQAVEQHQLDTHHHVEYQHIATDGGYPQPEIGDLVTFVDSDGNENRGIVVHGAPNDHYVSLVTSEQGEFGIDYTWSVTTHTSVYPHYTVWPEGEHATHAFIPGWDE
jgi:hypothetical protein